MHLIVGFACSPGGEALAALPALDRLLAQWVEGQRGDGDESTLSPPHERALAAALGLHGADGCLPWAARSAAADGIAVGTRAWGLLTPAHWRVGSDGVHMADPQSLSLSDAESRALFDAVGPLFASEGYTLAWGAAQRWYAAHDSMQGLATASLDRVVGRNVDAWLPRQPEAKPMRRLQNEVQMLLHGHTLNEAREAAGALPVNSFWFSGCGVVQSERNTDVRLDQRLRGPALQGDEAALCAAWQAIDAEAIAPLLAAAARGEPAKLTLCGERCSVTFAPRERSTWRRLVGIFSAPRVDARRLLETL